MQTHDQFEELCAMSACGEITPDGSLMLGVHLDECPSCREILADLREIHAQVLPAHRRFKSSANERANPRLRQAILDRAAAAGARLSEAARRSENLVPIPSSFQASRIWWGAAAAIVLLGNLGFWMIHSWTSAATRESGLQKVAVSVSGIRGSQEKGADSQELEKARERFAALEKRLSGAEQNAALVRGELQEAERRASVSEQSKIDSAQVIADLKVQLNAAREDRLKIEGELKKVQASDAANQAIAAAEEQEIRELNAKLEQSDKSLGREQDLLSAGREIRDLISARNLHIIDVYDTDGNGKTSRAFGRVFYTEGRSLVFYAYDLNSAQSDATRYAFYVWGRRDASPQDVRSLGKLNRDDQTQKRWVLTIRDPQILAEVDSVFVTLESSDKLRKKPSGKPLLSAFLNSPANHP